MMQDTVLAMEAKHLSVAHGRASDDEMTPKGLCNAIIVARPGSTFVKRWLETYEAFDDKQWADHSVVSHNSAATTCIFTLIGWSTDPADPMDSSAIVSNNRDCAIRTGVLLADVVGRTYRCCIRQE
jgi:hypothetical protein